MNKTKFLMKLTTHLAKSKKPVVLVAGNITAEVCENRFNAASFMLKQRDFHVINPCDFIDFDEHWLSNRQKGIMLLTQAENIYLLKDWNNCKETRLLHELASQLGINCIYE